jgi:putative ABC transport system permease protein
MYKNYLLIAFRNLLRNKTQSFINIVGLSVGMAVAMIIGLWIWNELSFDKYHENYDRIAQVMEKDDYNGNINTRVAIPLPLDAALRKQYGSDFRHIVMASWTGSYTLSVGDKKINYSGNFMGAEGPDLFSLKMLRGARKGLQDPSSILISQSVATALFGDADPMDQWVKFDNGANLKVTGVYEDLPNNTTLHDIYFIAPWDLYVSSRSWVQRALTKWNDNSFQMYVQIVDNTAIALVSEKIKNIKLNSVGADAARLKPVIFLQPMSRWHLYSEFKNGFNTGGAIQYVWLFGLIGIFTLLLACINFMNLSTARSEKRAKEVGIRKAIGSGRVQLISQFFSESLLMTVCAFAFSLALVWLVLPFFNKLADKQMTILWTNPFFWMINSGFILFTGLIAGSYPALYLSSFQPVRVLKGSFKAGRLAAIPRKALIIVQFTVSIILMIGTAVVFKQIQFAKNRSAGYSRDGLINIYAATDDLHNHFDAVRADLMKTGAIIEMAESSSPATAIHNSRDDVSWNGMDPVTASDFANIYVTSAFGKTVGWQFLTGRDFSNRFQTDSSAVILNEAAVKYMGLKNPVGEIIRFDKKEHIVIGVVKDMIMESPYSPVKQTIFYLAGGDFDNLIMKLNPNENTHDAVTKIAAVCKAYSPSQPFSYEFVDDEYARKFANEERIGELAGIFTGLTIFISCLGLFGVAAFMAEQRVKEIGLRKVLGATVFNLWSLLSKDFILMVVISLFIATPVAYYLMGNWLLNYQYRSDMPWWVFASAGAGALIITLLTVSYQTIKAALSNPVKSLRTE